MTVRAFGPVAGLHAESPVKWGKTGKKAWKMQAGTLKTAFFLDRLPFNGL